MRVVIFANGILGSQPSLSQSDLIIAADGGARHCLTMGIVPQAVIGDFDSLTEQELNELSLQGANLIRYPERKDFTDLELAMDYAHEQGATEIVVFGGLGARWDQTLANLLLPVVAGMVKTKISFHDGAQEIHYLGCKKTRITPVRINLHGKAGDIVSLIPLAGDAIGITTTGLEYPLHDETLFFGATRGVSNLFTATEVSVSLRKGLLLCILIHQ